LSLKQIPFAAAQLLLCVFALVNVNNQAVPAGDSAACVPRWNDATVNPPVHAVRTAEAMLKVKGLPRS